MTVTSKTAAQNDSEVSVADYHQRTKHSLQRYAKGPEALDWSLQPDPFRHYEGSAQIALPLSADKLTTGYPQLYQPDQLTPQALTLENIACLLELSMALSAWKQYGPDKWALRCNPSSGNLHPTEAYLVNWDAQLTAPAIYHYRSDQHALEQRCTIEAGVAQNLQQQVTQPGFVIGLSSIHWREAWKYGERAYRYCQLDIGHAIAAISYAAACLGWQVRLLDNISDAEINRLLGLQQDAAFDNAEQEHPDVLLYISSESNEDAVAIITLLKDLCDYLDECNHWQGVANRLDRHPMYQWPVIDAVSHAATKPETSWLTATNPTLPALPALQQDSDTTELSASQLIRQRRSAQAFDPRGSIDADAFFQMLDKLMPRNNVVPWQNMPLPTRIHPVFYLHRVNGLASGLYVLPRTPQGEQLLRTNLSDKFIWQKVDNCPAHLPLYLLIAANAQNAARTVSCHQDIAGHSAFAVSMLAEYHEALQQGEWHYRYLHWEAGMLGQVLYLEAEAINQRGTGIGCFFDDAVHQTLGIDSDLLQVVYHFTLGTPYIDQRLISLPPYSHLQR